MERNTTIKDSPTGFMPLEPDNKELKVLPIKETPVSFHQTVSVSLRDCRYHKQKWWRLIVVIPFWQLQKS